MHDIQLEPGGSCGGSHVQKKEKRGDVLFLNVSEQLLQRNEYKSINKQVEQT